MRKAEKDSLFKFSRSYRLVSKHEFQSVFANSRKITHKYLLVLYRFNQKNYARLGIIIGKHLVKLAVDRNQIRRVLRESFRHHKESLKGLDIVVVMRSKCTPLLDSRKRPAKNQQTKSLRTDIDYLWHRLMTSLKTV